MKKYGFFLVACAVLLGGCHTYDNFTTYFNTYYNAKRLMTEIEDEFDFQDEGKRVKPRVLVAGESTLLEEPRNLGETPAFLQDFIISKEKLQPVKTKVDSIIIKGSKILSKHPNSNYIDGTLFLMAKSYFYQSDWLPSQVKCQELIDNFPHSDFSPAGHLFLAKNQFMQRKYSAGEKTLSRAVDIAWGQENYEVLSEAFRLQAELALYRGDLEEALKPYRRAIAQAGDNELRARWQTDLASILFRRGNFEAAAREFDRVDEYSPDVLASFESQLYLGASLVQLGQYDAADAIFTELERNSNYDEWEGHVKAERLTMLRLQQKNNDLLLAEQHADTAYIGNASVGAAMYGHGLELFKEGKYTEARKYFAKSKVVRSPVHQIAGKYFSLLNAWEEKMTFVSPLLSSARSGTAPDSMRAITAASLFEIGRIHDQLGNADSARHYYDIAVEVSPAGHSDRARYLYALSRSIALTDSARADSLLDLIVMEHPLSEYALEARVRLGYTDAAVIDSVAELFLSGTSFRSVGEYRLAIRQFARLADAYPESDLAAKALYTAGWIFERNLLDNDSAYAYYYRLVMEYPQSEYAMDIRPSVLYAQAIRRGEVTDTVRGAPGRPNPTPGEQPTLQNGQPGGQPDTGEQAIPPRFQSPDQMGVPPRQSPHDARLPNGRTPTMPRPVDRAPNPVPASQPTAPTPQPPADEESGEPK